MSIAAEALYWLNSEGSLTALLEAKAGQPLRVERTFEGYHPLTLTQKKQMGYQGAELTRPIMAWVRKSLLYGNSAKPWVAAESVFPLISLKGEARRLQHLGTTPIGYVLFKRQNRLSNRRIIEATDLGWCRSTIYSWHRRKVLISETFLADFWVEDL